MDCPDLGLHRDLKSAIQQNVTKVNIDGFSVQIISVFDYAKFQS